MLLCSIFLHIPIIAIIFFLRLDLTIARLNWNLLCSPSCPRPHSATRKTFDRWQSSRLGFLTAKSTDGAHLAGCMLSKGSQCACVWIEWGCESWRCRLQGWSSCHAFWWFCRLAFWDGCWVPGSHFLQKQPSVYILGGQRTWALSVATWGHES